MKNIRIKIKPLLVKIQFQKVFVYSLGQFFNLVAPLVVVPYIVKTCGEENFGKTAIGMAMAFFIIVFTDFGSDILGVKQVSVNRHNVSDLSRTISLNFFLRFCMMVVFIIGFIILTLCVPYLREEKHLFLLSLTIVIGQFLNPGWILQGLEDFKLLSVFSVFSKLIYALFVFLLLKKESDYIFVNFAFGMGIIISGVVVLLYLKYLYKIKFVRVSLKEVTIYFRGNYSFVVSQIFTWLQLYFPVILIGLIGGDLLAGQFRVVDQILSIFKSFIIISFNFIFPKVCYEIGQGNRQLWSWKTYNFGVLFLIITLSIITYIFSFQLMDYYNTTNRYFLNNLMKVSLIYPIVFCITFAFKQLLLAIGENKSYSRITILMSIFTILGIIITFKWFGLFGVFYTLIFAELITGILFFLFLKRNRIF